MTTEPEDLEVNEAPLAEDVPPPASEEEYAAPALKEDVPPPAVIPTQAKGKGKGNAKKGSVVNVSRLDEPISKAAAVRLAGKVLFRSAGIEPARFPIHANRKVYPGNLSTKLGFIEWVVPEKEADAVRRHHFVTTQRIIEVRGED